MLTEVSVSLTRARDFVWEKAVAVATVKERTDIKQCFVFGMKIGGGGVLFLWLCRLVDRGLGVYLFPLVAMFAFLYAYSRRIHQFWIPLGMTVGAFAVSVAVLPILVAGERVFSMTASFLERFHYAESQIFSGWNTVQWIVIGASCSFLPFVLGHTSRHIKSTYVLIKTHRKAWADNLWAKREVLPIYEMGQKLMVDDPAMSAEQRDRIAVCVAKLSPESVDAFAVAVARLRRLPTQAIRAEMQSIQTRSIMRINTDRFKTRNRR